MELLVVILGAIVLFSLLVCGLGSILFVLINYFLPLFDILFPVSFLQCVGMVFISIFLKAWFQGANNGH